MMLTRLAVVARRTGYPVIEVPGWKTRGRPGGMNGVRTITCHHTANGGAPGNYPSLRVVRDGRAGLPGPLAQYGLGVDGTIYVIAAGKCNHAGASKSVDYTNPWAVGIEAEAEGVPGDKEDWPPKQLESYYRLCRALIGEFHLSVADVRGHKETAAPGGRKTDPDFSMAGFRNDVSDVNLSTPPKELIVPLENKDVDLVWNRKNATLGDDPAGVLKLISARAKSADDRAKAAMDRVDADNFRLQVKEGLDDVLADANHPLSVKLASIEGLLSELVRQGHPPTP